MQTVFPQNITKLSRKEIFDFLKQRLLNSEEAKPFLVVTLNPEIALLGAKNLEFADILKESFVVIDGFCVKLLAWLIGKKVGERKSVV